MGKKERVLITAALPYANGQIHFGHIAGAYLPADCYARFLRLSGRRVLFISGSDQYGIAVTMSAEKEGRSVKEYAEHFHKINRDLFKRLDISFDHYSKTTYEGHKPFVQEIFLDLLKQGHIKAEETEQLYSEKEEKFLADRYVVGTCPKCGFEEARGDECPKCAGNYEATDLKNPRSKVTGAKLALKKTKHWFLLCDQFRKPLRQWLAEKDWRSNVLNFVRPYIDDLRPRAITRDLKWGVPVPLEGAEDKVLYVWFDAPIGYISATHEWAKNIGSLDAWKDFWLDEKTHYVQFIGKDNIVFHAAIFPAMLMGQKKPYKQVDDLVANEFLNLEGKQFSKSTGWYVDLAKFLDRYPVSTIRYTLAANAPETQDSEFTWKDFQMRVNTELLGKFGNFIHRTLSFIHTRMEQKVPEPDGYNREDNDFLAEADQLLKKAEDAYQSHQIRRVCQVMMELADLANAYFDQSKPWQKLKYKEQTASLNTTMYSALLAVKKLALIAYPIMPDIADQIWKMLGFHEGISFTSWEVAGYEDLVPNAPLPKPEVLFQKIEDETITYEVEMLKAALAKQEEKKTSEKPEISFEQFSALDLRVAEIKQVEAVPKSSKLLKIEVDLAGEKRTIVSGIAKHFASFEDLIGKKVVIVANLKPTKIMGIESQGMILAAGEGTKLELPTLTDIAPGVTVS